MDGFLFPKKIGGELVFSPSSEKETAIGLKHLGEGIAVTFFIKKAINLKAHNQFFAVLSRAVENMEYVICDYKTKESAVEDLLIKLKYATGFTVITKDFNGKEVVVPRSIAFDDCSEEDRELFRTRSYAVLCSLFKCTMQELLEG